MITEYEEDLPVESIRSLTKMVMARDFNKYQFGLDLLNIQSFTAGQLFQSQLVGMAAPTHFPSDEEFLAAAQALDLAQSQGQVGALPGGLLLILKWALKKMLELL